jgi:hypothetical protein
VDTGLHSSTFRLNENTFCGIPWVVSVTETAQAKVKCGVAPASSLPPEGDLPRAGAHPRRPLRAALRPRGGRRRHQRHLAHARALAPQVEFESKSRKRFITLCLQELKPGVSRRVSTWGILHRPTMPMNAFFLVASEQWRNFKLNAKLGSSSTCYSFERCNQALSTLVSTL